MRAPLKIGFLSAKALPTFRLFFPAPPLWEARLLITDSRLFFVGFFLGRLVRQESSIWFPDTAPSNEIDTDVLTSVKTGTNGLGLSYIEFTSHNPRPQWLRSKDLSVRITTQEAEAIKQVVESRLRQAE